MCIKLKEKHFCFIQNQLIFYYELSLIWSHPLDQTKTHIASLGKLGCGWQCLTTPYQQYGLQSFPSTKNVG